VKERRKGGKGEGGRGKGGIMGRGKGKY